MLSAFTVIPVPAPTANVREVVISPPPVKPAPAVRVMLSCATFLVWSVSRPTESAATVIPVPAPTLSVTEPLAPPPVRPSPAITSEYHLGYLPSLGL